jgi:hypothetical protein
VGRLRLMSALVLKSPVFSGVRSPMSKMEVEEVAAMDCDDLMKPLCVTQTAPTPPSPRLLIRCLSPPLSSLAALRACR